MDDSNLVLLGVLLSPIVGKWLEMMPRATQACLERNSLSVEVVKYTIWRVSSVSFEGEVPEILMARAPMMSMGPLLAAVIFMVTGR